MSADVRLAHVESAQCWAVLDAVRIGLLQARCSNDSGTLADLFGAKAKGMMRGDVMTALRILLAILVLVGPLRASAEGDTFFLGNGQDGFRAVTAREVVNRYMNVTASLSTGATKIPVDDVSPSGFSLEAGHLVLVLQIAGTGLASGEPVNLGAVSSGKLGQWEFARLSDVDSSGDKDLLLTRPLINSYDKDHTQVIYVPEYISLYVSTTGRIEAAPWDGFKGGVIAFLVRDTLINDGTISASGVKEPAVGAGFRGAQAENTAVLCTATDLLSAPRGEGLDVSSYNTLGSNNENVATAGGGGWCERAGGGGGGGVGAGGNGGNTNTSDVRGGQGGAGTTHIFTDVPWRLILGGGGGSGSGGGQAGGTGGGAILIRASSLFGVGHITANGFNATNSTSGGGSGGGAGGTIILRVVNPPDCLTLSATGGKGGNANATSGAYGPGGGGGGGRIFLQGSDVGRCSSNVTVTGGLSGTSTSGGARGAGAGTGGTSNLLAEPLTAPGDVTISFPSQGGLVNTRRPNVTVQAPANRSVYLRFSASPTTLVGPLSYSSGTYSGMPSVDLGDGPHTVFAYAEYQRLRSEERSLSFNVDATPPDTRTPTTKPSNPTNSSSAQFVLDASESGVTFKCSLGDSNEPSEASFGPCGQDTTYHDLQPGFHTLWMRAIDAAGNADPTPASYTWEIDQQKPGAPSITAPTPSAFVDTATPVIQGLREADVEVLVYIDDASDSNASRVPADGGVNWSFTPSALSPSQHSVRVLAKDPAGNVSSFSATVLFTVDTQSPFVNITYPGVDAGIRDNPIVVRGETEPGSSVAITLLSTEGGLSPVAGAGGSVPSVPAGATVGTPGEWRYEVPVTVSQALDDGTYVVRARATDAASNSSLDVDRQFVLDRQPPDTRVVCPEKRFIKDDTVSFSFGADGEAAQSYDCMLETGVSSDPVTCEGGLTLDRSTGTYEDGTYTLWVRAWDAAGNVDPHPAACSWIWDKTPPGPVTIVGPSVTDSKLAAFDFSASDVDDLSAPVEYECLLWDPKVPIDPNSEFHDCTDPYPITVSLEGDHLLRVRSRDLAGNVSGEERTHLWTVNTDLPVPVILRISGANNPTNAGVAKFQFKLKVDVEDPSQIVYSYTEDQTEPKQFITLQGATLEIETPKEGVYYIQIRAEDTARGLKTPQELWADWSWTVDRKPPLVEIVDQPTAWQRVHTASFVFSAPGETTVQGFRCAISDCSPVGLEPEDCTDTRDGSRASFLVNEGLQEGPNCIKVWAVDLAGNLSATPDEYEWNIDTQAPEPPVVNTTRPGELKVATRIPSVEGTAEPYADVAVLLGNLSDSNKPVWVSANDQGRWKALIAQEVADGTHTLRAWAKDRAGNEGRETEPITLVVDSQSPAQVVGGGVGCTSSGPGGSLLALLGLMRLLYRGRARRCE